jgi:hypothetical protein
MKLTGENRQLGEKPVPVPLCPPQTPHRLTRDRTRASAVEGRRLTPPEPWHCPAYVSAVRLLQARPTAKHEAIGPLDQLDLLCRPWHPYVCPTVHTTKAPMHCKQSVLSEGKTYHGFTKTCGSVLRLEMTREIVPGRGNGRPYKH